MGVSVRVPSPLLLMGLPSFRVHRSGPCAPESSQVLRNQKFKPPPTAPHGSHQDRSDHAPLPVPFKSRRSNGDSSQSALSTMSSSNLHLPASEAYGAFGSIIGLGGGTTHGESGLGVCRIHSGRRHSNRRSKLFTSSGIRNGGVKKLSTDHASRHYYESQPGQSFNPAGTRPLDATIVRGPPFESKPRRSVTLN
jgi:hypothetical protein